MLRLNGKVKVDLSKLKAIASRVLPRSDAMVGWKERSAQRVRSFWFRRFDRFSRGGGNWRSTQRRKGHKGKRKPFILRQTHTLIRALSPVFRGLPGQWQKLTGNKIETGYGGSAKHPRAPMSVAKLARIHNNGGGRVARRQIIVNPSAQVKQSIVEDLERTVKRG